MIPFKGPVLALQAYGDLGMRNYVDIDILINPRDFHIVYKIMKEEGFQPVKPLSPGMKRYWIRTRRDFEFARQECFFDFHQRLTQGPIAFELTEKEMKENYSIYLFNTCIRTLSPENTILYICINSTKDQWDSLRSIADLKYYLDSNPDINWEGLIHSAKKKGILRMVLVNLQLICDLTGKSLPNSIKHLIEKDKKMILYTEKIKSHTLSEKADHRMFYRVRSILKTLDSFRHRLWYLLYFFFSPTPVDSRFVPLPEVLYPFYKVFRPFRLIFSVSFEFLKKYLKK